MKPLFLIAGHFINDPGALSHGKELKEADITVSMRDLIAFFVKHKSQGKIKIYMDDDKLNLKSVITWLNKTAVGENRVILDIHCNAFNGVANGTEVLIPPTGATEIERRLAARICENTSRVLGIKNRGVRSKSQHATLAIMKPKGINLLWELCFIDNASDKKALMTNFATLAETTADILIEECLN
jgi:N-acetylmuramoyl-L-alanine amidase